MWKISDDSILEDNIYDGDFVNSFDHSFGPLFGGGMFCWENRHGGKTFFYTPSEDRFNEEGYMLFIRDKEAHIISFIAIDSDKAFWEAENEYGKDGWPKFQVPSFDDLFTLETEYGLLPESLSCVKNVSAPPLEWFRITYLTPNRDYSFGDELWLLEAGRRERVLPNGVKSAIRSMDYKEFLTTPYWRIIADNVKQRIGHCQLCGAEDNLQVHHSNYDSHGDELHNCEDLTVLCAECHSKYHKLWKDN